MKEEHPPDGTTLVDRTEDSEGVRFLQWALPRLGLRWRGYRRVRRHVYRAIARRTAQLGLSGLASYRAFLDGHDREWSVLDALCRIPISRFLRDRGAFEYLRTVVLPELSRTIVARGEDELRCWSIGCASGEEPYTIAIVWRLALADAFPRLRLRIVATDTDREALGRAVRAIYPAHGLRDVPPAVRAEAFDEVSEGFALRPEHRAGVEFVEQDVRVQMPNMDFHLILCRNLVFTYFDEALQRRVLRRIVDRLAPGGALMIGSAERLPGPITALDPWSEHLRVYRRAGAPSGAAVGGHSAPASI